jgi:hypothetical protein
MNNHIRVQPIILWGFVLAGLLFIAPIPGHAQRGGPPLAPVAPRAAGAVDLTGYWVSPITEDWRYRMLTPPAGEYRGVPLSNEGRRVADTWDPARDVAAGEECKAYSAPAIMRVPGRLQISWEDDNTLRIDTDAGMQTRLFHFGAATAPEGEPTWQGHSVAEYLSGGGREGVPSNLMVVTTDLRPGYVRKNGVPYSEDAILTEHFDYHQAPNGDQWLVVTTILEDPVYFNGPFVTSSNFKKLPDDSGWNPTPCRAS